MTDPETTENEVADKRQPTRGESQFTLRGMFSLTAAFALWIFLLPDLRHEPIAVAIFWTLAICAGIAGQLLYMYVLAWRVTVVTSVFVLSVVTFAAVATVNGWSDDVVIDLLMMPIDLFVHQGWSDRIWYMVPRFACITILTAAHPIKPGLINAIITALGISMWFAFALVIGASAG